MEGDLPTRCPQDGPDVKFDECLTGAERSPKAPEAPAAADATSTWFVLCTRPRAEKRLRTLLRSWHVLNVLPSYVKSARYQRRTVKNEIPLFPGYLMARLDAGERIRVLRSGLAFAALPLPNPRAVLRQLRLAVRAARAGGGFRLVPHTPAGASVRVAEGPLKGLVGRVRNAEGMALLSVGIEAFGGAFEVQVAPEDCVPLVE